MAPSQTSRILALKAKGHDAVAIATRLMIGYQTVIKVLSYAPQRLAPVPVVIPSRGESRVEVEARSYASQPAPEVPPVPCRPRGGNAKPSGQTAAPIPVGGIPDPERGGCHVNDLAQGKATPNQTDRHDRPPGETAAGQSLPEPAQPVGVFSIRARRHQARHLNEGKGRPLAIEPYVKAGPPTRTCVYVAGVRPYGDDPWCGKPVRRGEDGNPNSSYCEPHHALCYLKGKSGPVYVPPARVSDGRSFR